MINNDRKIPRIRMLCPKGFVNGSCGSFVDGKCEVDKTKDCAWVLVYERLKKDNNTKKFVNQYVAPKK
ncbi:MAG: methylenetetrahydrofolate reductase C-terminal domain-containing protein [Endomicrobium sp.]|jgi:electron transport complex protein RnfC|nr:methylenetetrahydrofolate reductase C-terminal domain-containing protein [Endomicrobium sp.]